MTFWLNKRTSPFARLQGGYRIYRPRRLRANFFARLGSVQSVSRFMIEALQRVYVCESSWFVSGVEGLVCVGVMRCLGGMHDKQLDLEEYQFSNAERTSGGPTHDPRRKGRDHDAWLC